MGGCITSNPLTPNFNSHGFDMNFKGHILNNSLEGTLEPYLVQLM